MNQHFYIIYRD